MCNVLQIARSTFYYETSVSVEKERQKARAEQELKDEIWAIFHENRRVYGTRKLKEELKIRKNWIVSRRRIGRLMATLGIQSKYALPSYKPMVRSNVSKRIKP